VDAINLEADVVPSPSGALSNTLFQLAAGESQEELGLSVKYAGSGGGYTKYLKPYTVKIHYSPAPWLCIAALLLGSLLGSGVTLAFPDTWRLDSWWRIILVNLPISLTVYVLARAGGAKLEIYKQNLQIDQLIPCVALGLIVSLVGVKALDIFNIPLPNRNANQTPDPAHPNARAGNP
jgi:hypothetical protein